MSHPTKRISTSSIHQKLAPIFITTAIYHPNEPPQPYHLTESSHSILIYFYPTCSSTQTLRDLKLLTDALSTTNTNISSNDDNANSSSNNNSSSNDNNSSSSNNNSSSNDNNSSSSNNNSSSNDNNSSSNNNNTNNNSSNTNSSIKNNNTNNSSSPSHLTIPLLAISTDSYLSQLNMIHHLHLPTSSSPLFLLDPNGTITHHYHLLGPLHLPHRALIYLDHNRICHQLPLPPLLTPNDVEQIVAEVERITFLPSPHPR